MKDMLPHEIEALLHKIRTTRQLTEDEFIEHCLNDMMGGWIPVTLYVRLYPTENLNKIHKRVQQGVWQRQVHYAVPKGGTGWVNLPAIRLWLEGKLEA
jgi:hypothetical protein